MLPPSRRPLALTLLLLLAAAAAAQPEPEYGARVGGVAGGATRAKLTCQGTTVSAGMLHEYELQDSGKYIVGLHADVPGVVESMQDVWASFKPEHIFSKKLSMFVAVLNAQQVRFLLEDSRTKYIECDSQVTIAGKK